MRLVIPRIGVQTSLVGVGLNADGTVETPPLRGDAPAGWYRYLASPGEVGPAVILGHVDTARDGPAVFYRLGELRPGDPIDVTRADGIVARFVVTRVVLVAKVDFPTADVYGPTPDPQLRLVTCGGSYDRVRHSYRDNVIAFARLAPSR
ncbi:peptidase C60 [Intrasporangium oryzae NRRL B-24470]|uniref:Peptidase C60 n=1 Tax=Intrasporangium oryzae NRRL B-24470 TaxID=1386089 RepID=W9GFD2_9MICO|nr:peptidase C60 [Intrasporangium oryzae NRRL B-24470]